MMKPQSSHSGVSIQESRQGGSGPDRSERVCFVGQHQRGLCSHRVRRGATGVSKIEQAESSSSRAAAPRRTDSQGMCDAARGKHARRARAGRVWRDTRAAQGCALQPHDVI
ncbi:unnamed protein product [Gadus morhua 'NCC']